MERVKDSRSTFSQRKKSKVNICCTGVLCRRGAILVRKKFLELILFTYQEQFKSYLSVLARDVRTYLGLLSGQWMQDSLLFASPFPPVSVRFLQKKTKTKMETMRVKERERERKE